MALNHNQLELEVLEAWNRNGTFIKSVQNRKGRKPFIMYEGPPTANGKPGIHHVLTRTFKDMVARYKTMRGHYVERRAGWDEHGLPVEIEIQKELGLLTKADIEQYGVDKFNARCSQSTMKYIADWERVTQRMGYWLDFSNGYRTSDKGYIEQVWDLLSHLFYKKLIYKDNKIVPWACDSGTVVSNAEVAQGYKEVTDTSAYIMFQLECENTVMIAWTTTPWTLPSNMALAVNPAMTYYRVYYQPYGYHFIVSKDFAMNLPRFADMEVTGEFTGMELTKMSYHPLFEEDSQELYPILPADFVKNEKTGVVHIAPAFGQDDYNLYKSFEGKRPILCHVNTDGTMNDEAPCGLSGRRLFNKTFEGVNKIILDHLEEHGKLWKAEPYTHEYPHNWRTGAPLIYYLRPSWYFNTNAIRDLMVAANDKVTWYPDHVKEGRFGEWLKNNVDWAISRERFWGTPLPFFVQGDNITTRHPVGYHKPQADDGFRTPEVLDCWFDSGAMPFAAYQEYVQADFICEATDQTRGWFYALMAIGVAVKGESPFKTVLCLGHVLDKNGQKMSKTKGNVVDPEVMFQKYGADAVRWYMAKCPVGNSLIFNEKDVEGITKSFLNRLWNSFTFFDMYAKIETFKELAFGGTDSTDQWIFARRKQLIKTCADGYDNYNFISVALAIEKFVDDLSNVWIRANRSRFWNTDGGKTDKYAFTMLYRCLSVVCQVAAPIIPFITDKIWNGLSEERVSSVHLTDWPTFLPLTDGEKELVTDMELAQSLVEAGHKIRNEKGVKIRQALLSISVPEKPKHFEQVVLDELNIKQMLVGDLQIDFTMTEELLAEGVARDFVREIQTLRKRMGLEVTDRIAMKTNYGTNTKLKERLTKHSGDISKKLLVVEWTEDEPSSINGVYVNLNEDKIAVEIVKK